MMVRGLKRSSHRRPVPLTVPSGARPRGRASETRSVSDTARVGAELEPSTAAACPPKSARAVPSPRRSASRGESLRGETSIAQAELRRVGTPSSLATTTHVVLLEPLVPCAPAGRAARRLMREIRYEARGLRGTLSRFREPL